MLSAENLKTIQLGKVWASNLIIIFFCVLTISDVEAQRKNQERPKVFSAGLIGGLNFSQIDGDDYTGYDKRSLFGGFQAIARINDRWSFNVNFLYVSKGANIENEYREFKVKYDKDRTLHFQYAEVPLMVRFNPRGNQSRWYFEGGLSYGKMLSSDITERVDEFTEIVFESFEKDFKKSEWSAVCGAGVKATESMSVGIRFTYGLTKFYFNKNPTEIINPNIYYPAEIDFLRNYFGGIHIAYRIL
jgi:hypothetical protein